MAGVKRRAGYAAVVLFQLFAVSIFAGEIIVQATGWVGPIPWSVHESIEIVAVIAMLLGVVMGSVALKRSLARAEEAEDALRRAQEAFQEVLDRRFEEWRLTPAESEVTVLALKGLTGAAIAERRGTTEGTVKAQTAAIYRKAGVSGRPQLMSLFLEEMLAAVPDATAEDFAAARISA